jgi:putative copper resistance protein D
MYYTTVTIHVLAALLWLGGMFFLAVVGAPVLRRIEDVRLRRDLFKQLGVQFRNVGWMAIGVLLVTGVLNMHFRGVLSWPTLSDPAFWATRYGTALGWKLGAVAVMLGIQAVHDFWFGPASSRAEPGTPEAIALRRRAALLARLNALVGVVLVIAAVRLARGG